MLIRLRFASFRLPLKATPRQDAGTRCRIMNDGKGRGYGRKSQIEARPHSPSPQTLDLSTAALDFDSGATMTPFLPIQHFEFF